MDIVMTKYVRIHAVARVILFTISLVLIMAYHVSKNHPIKATSPIPIVIMTLVCLLSPASTSIIIRVAPHCFGIAYESK